MGVLFAYFGAPACTLNQFFIAINLIFSIISLAFSECVVGGSFLTGAMVNLTTIYYLIVALIGSPNAACNPIATSSGTAASDTTKIVGMIFSALALVWGVYSLSQAELTYAEKERLIQDDPEEKAELAEERKEAIEDGDVPARKTSEELEASSDENMQTNYLKFHFIMLFASCYMAMLFSNWGNLASTSNVFGTSEITVWVNIISNWMIFGIYALWLGLRWCNPEAFELENIRPEY